jgi:bacterioferritin (cytochrome b1)
MRTHADPGAVRHAVDVLNDLIQLEYDTMAAYRAALDRIDSVNARRELAQFFGDHEAHARSLASCVERYGGRAKTGGDLKQLWTRGRVILADLAGDEAVLAALRRLESEVHRAYERAQHDLRMVGDAPLAAAFDAALAHEDHHVLWLGHAIDGPVKPA